MKLNKKKSLHDLLMESYKPHLVDFAEASVFSFGEFRKKKYDAVWTVKSIGKIQGHRVNGEMKIDYGIFFDPSDAYIQEVMTYFFPEIDWTGFVFHRSMDSSQIEIVSSEDFSLIAKIQLRGHRYHRQRHPVETYLVKQVVNLAERRVKRQLERKVEASTSVKTVV